MTRFRSSSPRSSSSAWAASRCFSGRRRVRVIGGTIAVGVLISFMMYAQRFFRPIQDLSEKFNILQAAMAASERIFKLLDEPMTIASPATRSDASCPARRDRIPQRLVRLSRRRDIPRTKTGFCATFPSASSPARRSRSSDTPAPARPRSSSFCCASTTSSAARSCSMAWTFARWICRICAACSASCSRIPSFSPARWNQMSDWEPQTLTARRPSER